MAYQINQHIVSPAQFIQSPNCSARPSDAQIELLIIHNISLPPGEFGTGCVEQLFCNTLDCDSHPYFADLRDLQVSAHLLIGRSGDLIQFVPFDLKAWHAGESVFEGRSNCNEYSIGIELEGTDFEPFTDAQYDTLVAVTDLLLKEYPCLNSRRIVGHSDVAPLRKTDPGPCFDWDRFRSCLDTAV